ncbi:MAG: hypothetical protein PUA86_03995, partial [Clostridiaceae bacterium]|nr:hypothetical protein [Clostridiaceae bacterium]
MKMMKKISCALIVTVLAVALMSALGVTSFAADVVASGTCGAEGDNLTWTLDSDGTLTISGVGEMADYKDYDFNLPW